MFDFRLMFRLIHLALFRARGTPGRLTPRRIGIILVLWPTFLIGQAVTWLCFLLDEVLFPGYRKIVPKEPVFVVGVPRSGTTFLHRVLARDEAFAPIRLWEINFAPSIVQRRFWMAVGALDRRLGSPMRGAVLRIERRVFRELDAMHRVSLFDPEEDDAILLNIFSSMFVGFAFPFPEELRAFAYFDEEMPPAKRERIMRFYRRMVQKHLYVHGPEKRFLSKNPAFSPKVESLRATFPDAKVICTVRAPTEMVPSFISLMSTIWRQFGDPVEAYPHQGFHLDLARHFYRYPVARLDTWPEASRAIVVYDDLVARPAETVGELYGRFGFTVSAAYAAALAAEEAKARAYKSGHAYTLEQFGLTEAELRAEYRDLYERFRFGERAATAGG